VPVSTNMGPNNLVTMPRVAYTPLIYQTTRIL